MNILKEKSKELKKKDIPKVKSDVKYELYDIKGELYNKTLRKQHNLLLHGDNLDKINYLNGRISIEGEGIMGEFTKFYSSLSSRTITNLLLISKKLDIIWEEVYKFKVLQKRHNRSYRNEGKYKLAWSILISGKDENEETWEFWRKETKHPAAGKTLLYKHGKNPKQISRYDWT